MKIDISLNEAFPVQDDTLEFIKKYKNKWRLHNEILRDALASQSSTAPFFKTVNMEDAVNEIINMLEKNPDLEKTEIEDKLNSTMESLFAKMKDYKE